MTILKKLLEPVLSHPEMLRINTAEAGGMEVATLSVHGADYGRICGRAGKNLATLKTLLEISDPDLRVILDPPLTPDRSEHVQRNSDWQPLDVIRMINAWLEYAEFHGCTVQATPAQSGGWNLIFTERIDPDVVNALARWAVVVANAQGGRIHVEGATHSAV